jgi:hypothetical protein
MVGSILVQLFIHSTTKHKAWEWVEVSQQNNSVHHFSKRPAILSFGQLLHRMKKTASVIHYINLKNPALHS